MAKANSKTPKALDFEAAAVRIKAPRDGYRRAGIAHTKAGKVHPPGTFTPEQIAALVADPNITVEPVAGKAAKDADA